MPFPSLTQRQCRTSFSFNQPMVQIWTELSPKPSKSYVPSKGTELNIWRWSSWLYPYIPGLRELKIHDIVTFDVWFTYNWICYSLFKLAYS